MLQKKLPPKKSIIKMNINPNLPRLRYLCMASLGKKDARTLEPSRGGMGIRLNIARNIFIYIAKIIILDIKRIIVEE